MALRRIDAETLLTPPAPPRDTVIMFFLASSMPLRMASGTDVDGSHELASIGKDQARTFIQSIGGAR